MPSSVILKYYYDVAERVLRITFVSGSVYIYKDVPESIFDQFKKVKSKGIFFNNYIKEKFAFEKIV